MEGLKKLGSLLLLIAALFTTLHLGPCTAEKDVWAGMSAKLRGEYEAWGSLPETDEDRKQNEQMEMINVMYNMEKKEEANARRQKELDELQGTQIAQTYTGFDPAKYVGLNVNEVKQVYKKASDQTKVLNQQIAEATRVRQLPIQPLQLPPQPIKPSVQAQVQPPGQSPKQSPTVELDERGAKPQSQRNAKLPPPVESDQSGAKPQQLRNAKLTLIENEQTSRGGPPKPQVVETHKGVRTEGNINTHLTPTQEGDAGVGGARLGTFSPPFGPIPITIQPIQSPPARKFGHTPHHHHGHAASGTGAGSGQYGAGSFHSSSGFNQNDPPSDVRFHKRGNKHGYSAANAMHGRRKSWNLIIIQLGLRCFLLLLLVLV